MIKWILILLVLAGVFGILGRRRLAAAAATAARVLVKIRSLKAMRSLLPI
jgi:uncharacterized membrane protein YtjA (UPF0391 family)